jgi:hypothetical protein
MRKVEESKKKEREARDKMLQSKLKDGKEEKHAKSPRNSKSPMAPRLKKKKTRAIVDAHAHVSAGTTANATATMTNNQDSSATKAPLH